MVTKKKTTTTNKSEYQICVSGAAKGKSVEEGKHLALAAGREIAKAGHMLLTGATIGLPNYAAIGAKEAGGMSVGISPASTKVAHVRKYRLPTGCYDVILYTGLHYVGRDTLLVSSSDAVISIGGRIGTLHEFTVAMEMKIPIGFVMGAGGVGDEIKGILKAAGKASTDNVIFDEDPKKLLKRITKMLDALNKDDLKLFREAAHCDIRTSILAGK